MNKQALIDELTRISRAVYTKPGINWTGYKFVFHGDDFPEVKDELRVLGECEDDIILGMMKNISHGMFSIEFQAHNTDNRIR